MYKPSLLVFGEDPDEVIKVANILDSSKKYQIYVAYSPGEAAAIIKKQNRGFFKLSKNKVKLLIFGSNMPEGFEFLKQIVKIAPDLRTIIISPDVQMNYWLDAYLNYKAITYLSKSFKEDELIWTVDAFFQGKEDLIKSWTFRDISMMGRG